VVAAVVVAAAAAAVVVDSECVRLDTHRFRR
jgi:hypothetical protein